MVDTRHRPVTIRVRIAVRGPGFFHRRPLGPPAASANEAAATYWTDVQRLTRASAPKRVKHPTRCRRMRPVSLLGTSTWTCTVMVQSNKAPSMSSTCARRGNTTIAQTIQRQTLHVATATTEYLGGACQPAMHARWESSQREPTPGTYACLAHSTHTVSRARLQREAGYVQHVAARITLTKRARWDRVDARCVPRAGVQR